MLLGVRLVTQRHVTGARTFLALKEGRKGEYPNRGGGDKKTPAIVSPENRTTKGSVISSLSGRAQQRKPESRDGIKGRVEKRGKFAWVPMSAGPLCKTRRRSKRDIQAKKGILKGGRRESGFSR